MSALQETNRKTHNRRTNRALIVAIKKQRGCDLCGNRDLCSRDLHFHHRDRREKEVKVSALVSRATLRVISEVLRCELWCKWAHNHFHRTGIIRCCTQKSEGGAR